MLSCWPRLATPTRCGDTPIKGHAHWVWDTPTRCGDTPTRCVVALIINMSSSDKGGLVKSSSSAGLVLAKDPLLLLKHKEKPKIALEEEEFTEV